MMRDLDHNVTGIGMLADPVRRQLYEFVTSQTDPVSRDRAAQAVGVARHQAKFHLDRLEAAGLVETDYVRLSGRTGPGAGRTAKRYRRGSREFTVALPRREYDLAGHIMAEAITDTARTGTPITEALHKAASAQGVSIAAAVNRVSSAAAAIEQTLEVLRNHGYEPHRIAQTVELRNCPFHRLALAHTQLVCQMNHSLITALAESLAPALLHVQLRPGENRCCVSLTEET
jgi:predicted ArsR family transcriptional regulator